MKQIVLRVKIQSEFKNSNISNPENLAKSDFKALKKSDLNDSSIENVVIKNTNNNMKCTKNVTSSDFLDQKKVESVKIKSGKADIKRKIKLKREEF